jgi:hypothetical protein
MRGLAQESLALLSAALFDCRFPALFSLDVYGSIVGMFELNNLGAVCLSRHGPVHAIHVHAVCVCLRRHRESVCLGFNLLWGATPHV